MSYLPSSRLYEPDSDPKPAPPPAVAAPKPAASSPRRATMMPKEWLVAPAPVLQVEAVKPAPSAEVPDETVTVPASALPSAAVEEPTGRKRNLFHKAHKVVLRHLERATNKAPEAAEPDLLWFAVMATGSLCMGLMIWGAYSALPRFGNVRHPLHAEASGHRLKSSSDVPNWAVREANSIPHPQHPPAPPLVAPVAQAPVVPAIPVSAPPPPHELTFIERRLPAVEHPAPAHVEQPLAALPERTEPAIFVHANRGETPMIRTWNELAKTAVLLTAMTPMAAHAFQADDKAPPPNHDEKFNALNKKFEDLDKSVKESAKASHKELKELLSTELSKLNKADGAKGDDPRLQLVLERLLDYLTKNSSAAPVAATGNLDAIKSKLDNIEQAIRGLQPAEKRTSFTLPAPEQALAKPATSNVIFVNLYSQDLGLWVNGKHHRAPAGMTLPLDSLPAGPTTIEIRWPEGILYRATPTLVPNETFTLTAR